MGGHHFAAYGRCGMGANLDMVLLVCWLGIGEQGRQASEGGLQNERLEIRLSAQKVGAGISA